MVDNALLNKKIENTDTNVKIKATNSENSRY